MKIKKIKVIKDLEIYNGEEIVDPNKKYRGGMFCSIEVGEEYFTKELLYDYLFDTICEIPKHLVEAVEESIEETEVEIPEGSYVVVRCIMLDDQWECDADRELIKIAKDYELLEFINDSEEYYEFYRIEIDGSLNKISEISTYEF